MSWELTVRTASPLTALNLCLFCQLESIIHLDPQVSNRTFQFGVTEQYLHCPQVLGPTVDHGCFCTPERMCPVGSWIEPNISNP